MTALPGKRSHLRIASISSISSIATIASFVLASVATVHAQEPIKIPMIADRWEANGNVEFTHEDGYPLGVMKVTKGVAVLKDLGFKDGTIEFDVIPTGPMGAGIGFRRRDDDTYEDFYLRPRPNCEAAPDCIQYAPQTHGVLLWDVFPQYQGPAPVKETEVNHIKLVVSGRRMNIFVNRQEKPALAIGRLEGDVLEGGLLMQGPGSFANLMVIPGAVEGLTPEPAADPTAGDKRFLRNWLVSPSASLPDGKEPVFTEMPNASQQWTSLSAEQGGLINLSRQMGLPTGRKVRALAWLKTDIDSNKAQTKQVSIGWSREIWVFVNGKQIYADKNLYQPPTARKKPDGRLSLENGSFNLPLQKGKNEIAVALANNFYGWGLELRLDDVAGVRFTPAGNAMSAQK
ncbi:hypothetical protein [Acidicapsa acidisoli]|uniref:hypothetical protein n=1 Tax=Acidicapsa acidisoli TaxID=1615681 RepID=UPI0021DFEABC|nr:hypothetical protein [Acidicapsa acidisoli]